MVEANGNGVVDGTIIAVGGARDVLPTPDLTGLRLVDTQTKAIGVIVPPPDIRAIVDKTAAFVARNGTEFEKRILANEANNVKFNFLRPTDPYHAYYQHKVKEGQDSDKEPAAAGTGQPKPAAASTAAAAAAATAAIPPPVVMVAAPVAPLKQLVKPDDPQYMVHVPEGLTSLDLDVIKLTAQFVARNGKSFLTGLAQREHANPQFSFLKPTSHSGFMFFTSLCDAYSRVLMPPKGLQDKLRQDKADRAAILERSIKRLEWERHHENEAQAAAQAADRERQAMQAIDWHDFVVVETIEFFDDEDEELPGPLTLRDVIQLNRQQPQEEAAAQPEAPPAEAGGAEDEMEVVMDEEERVMVAEGADTEPGGPPPEEEEEEAPVKIVRNYQRPEAKRPQSFDPTKFVVSPITGELVPIGEMAEHMRISLIDPKWREQRDVMMSKIRETTRAQDDEIGRNLVFLAKTRPDIFGSTQEEVQSVVRQTMQEAMISGGDRPVVWDGQTTKGDELGAQLRAIQKSKEQLAGSTVQPDVPAPRQQVGPAGPPRPPAEKEPEAKRQRTEQGS